MNDTTLATAQPLKPALASIRDACKYLGGLSRAKFYADILPKLESVHFGTRRFVVISSMDRFIAKRASVEGGLEGRVGAAK
jgi:hypothetical protein